jgi:hypothetical protein
MKESHIRELEHLMLYLIQEINREMRQSVLRDTAELIYKTLVKAGRRET